MQHFFFQSQIEPFFSIPQNITYLLQMWRRLAYLAASGKGETKEGEFHWILLDGKAKKELLKNYWIEYCFW